MLPDTVRASCTNDNREKDLQLRTLSLTVGICSDTEWLDSSLRRCMHADCDRATTSRCHAQVAKLAILPSVIRATSKLKTDAGEEVRPSISCFSFIRVGRLLLTQDVTNFTITKFSMPSALGLIFVLSICHFFWQIKVHITIVQSCPSNTSLCVTHSKLPLNTSVRIREGTHRRREDVSKLVTVIVRGLNISSQFNDSCKTVTNCVINAYAQSYVVVKTYLDTLTKHQ